MPLRSRRRIACCPLHPPSADVRPWRHQHLVLLKNRRQPQLLANATTCHGRDREADPARFRPDRLRSLERDQTPAAQLYRTSGPHSDAGGPVVLGQLSKGEPVEGLSVAVGQEVEAQDDRTRHLVDAQQAPEDVIVRSSPRCTTRSLRGRVRSSRPHRSVAALRREKCRASPLDPRAPRCGKTGVTMLPVTRTARLRRSSARRTTPSSFSDSLSTA